MAKPDDTRIAPASESADQANTANSRIANTPATHINTANATLIHVLEALLCKLNADNASPTPPKSARPPRNKPLRRVTVSASAIPATDDNIPRIRLCGNWLLPAGFGLHTRVRVHVAKDCLILIPEDAG